MNLPQDLKYTADHEWLRVEGDEAYVGITAFAQNELGDIVFIDVTTVGETLEKGAVFGSVEAVKTVSDLFLPLDGTVLEVNADLESNPELVNQDPYGRGWMVKIRLRQAGDADGLMTADSYGQLVGS